MTTKPMIAISADITLEAGDAEKNSPPKFTSTFYTGGAVRINGYDRPVVIDLAGLTPGNVLVANLDHDKTKRVGNFDLLNDGKQLVASGVASAATPARDEVVNSALAGYRWQSSFEVAPEKIEAIKAGQTVQVNGQSIAGPVYVTRKGTLKGFAFVSHGADDNTSATIAAEAASTKEYDMRAEVKTWIEASFKGIDLASLSDEDAKNFEATYDKLEGAKPKTVIQAGAGDSISKALLDAQRVEHLETLTASFLETIPPETRRSVDFLSGVNQLKNKAIAEAWTPEKYDTELVRATIPMARTVRTPRDAKRLSNDILKAALCQAGGLRDIDKHFTDEVLQTARDRFRDGIGLNQLLCIAAEDRGYRCDSFRANLEVQRAAFGMLGGPMMNASGFSTISLPGILSDSAYKFLLEGWNGGEQTCFDISDVTSVRDFKTITQYRLSGSLRYDKVGPGGELKHGSVSEDSYTLKADTYGKMFAITREHIINDDLNALSQIPRELGYGANDSLNYVFWTLFLSNPSNFFHSSHNNVATGVMSASAGLATIAAAEAVFFAQTKPNGEPVSLNPTLMLMPNGTYRTALAAMSSSLVTGGSSTVPMASPFSPGEYRVVRSAYLSNSAYSGSSSVKWYLLVNRPGMAVTQLAFLNGQRAPMIESASADFNTLGIQMRGVHDFGCSMFEYRAGVQGSGA